MGIICSSIYGLHRVQSGFEAQGGGVKSIRLLRISHKPFLIKRPVYFNKSSQLI